MKAHKRSFRTLNTKELSLVQGGDGDPSLETDLCRKADGTQHE